MQRNPIGLDAFAWKFYFFYVAWIAIQFAVVYLFFIEVYNISPSINAIYNTDTLSQTKGPSLEQIAVLFDGKDAVVSQNNPVVEDYLSNEKNEKDLHVEHVEKVSWSSTWYLKIDTITLVMDLQILYIIHVFRKISFPRPPNKGGGKLD